MNVAELFATLGLQINEGSFHRADKLIDGVKRGLEVFVGYEAVKTVGEWIKQTAEAGDSALKMAQKLGISSQAVQELEFAAKMADIPIEGLQHGMQHLARGLDEARTKGSGPAAEAFQRLGLSMSSIKDKSPDQVLGVIADRFAKMPDGMAKTALSMDLFGKQGTEMIPLLNKGAAGIDELRAKAEELGVVLDDKAAAAGDAFNDNIKELHASLDGLRNKAIGALLPMLSDLIKRFTAWLGEHHEQVISTISAAVNVLAVAMQALGVVFDVAATIFQFFSEHAQLAQAILIALGVVIAVFAIEAAAAWLIAFWPVALVIAAIAAIVLVVEDVWESISTGKGVTASIWHWISDKFKALYRGIYDVYSKIAGFFSDVGAAIKGTVEGVVAWLEAKIAWIQNKLNVLKSIAVDSVGGDAATNWVQGHLNPSGASPAPTRSDQGVTVNDHSTTTINVTSNNADPKAVADEVSDRAEQTWADQLRSAWAATGGVQ